MVKMGSYHHCKRILSYGVATIFFLVLACSAFAAPVSKDAAIDMVQGWLNESTERLGKHFGDSVRFAVPYHDEYGEILYYVVYVDPDGFVIVSADDLIEPIIAFSDHGFYDTDERNPLYKLVSNDTRERLNRVRNYGFLVSSIKSRGLNKTDVLPKSAMRSQKKWSKLKAKRKLYPITF